jgi:hypothetical protein
MTRAHTRCWWTWPLGHKWVKTVRHDSPFLVCTKCGKESDYNIRWWGLGPIS